MITILKDILEILPGTLIKGLKVNKEGKIGFSADGWKFEQKRLIKSLEFPTDVEQFVFTYYINSKIQEYVDGNKIHVNNKSNSFHVMKQNGNILLKDFDHWSKMKTIQFGDCLGMSLGENFIAIEPSLEIYRNDYYSIYVFHKILNNGKIKWVVLHSKNVSRQLVVYDNPELFNINLEMT